MRTDHRQIDHGAVRVLLGDGDAGPPREPTIVNEWRGLTSLGHAQARGLVAILDRLPLRRVLSSPSLRCRQTVVPLARRLGVEVEPCRLLASDMDPQRVATFLQEDETRDAALCMERSALWQLVTHVTASGRRLEAVQPRPDGLEAWLHRTAGLSEPDRGAAQVSTVVG